MSSADFNRVNPYQSPGVEVPIPHVPRLSRRFVGQNVRIRNGYPLQGIQAVTDLPAVLREYENTYPHPQYSYEVSHPSTAHGVNVHYIMNIWEIHYVDKMMTAIVITEDGFHIITAEKTFYEIVSHELHCLKVAFCRTMENMLNDV